MDRNGANWGTVPFGDVVEPTWAAIEGRRHFNCRSLWREVAAYVEQNDGEISYEGFRKMVAGELMPRSDVMEGTALALGINVREFPEYRLHQIMERCRRYPEVGLAFYDAVMAYTMDLEPEPQDANGRLDTAATGTTSRGRYGSQSEKKNSRTDH